MKAIFAPRKQQDRPKLEQHIPLSAPFIISVDPSDKCSLRCSFCPTSDHDLMKKTPGRWHGPMEFNLFKKIVDDIGKFERPIKVLRMYKDGEPFANPRFADMVAHAKRSGCSEVVDTTTNATLLTKEKSRAIVEAGLDLMNISIYGMNDAQYRKFCGQSYGFDKMIENIRYLYAISRGRMKINIKMNGDVVPEETKGEFLRVFGDICDMINIEHVMSCWSNFDYEAHGIQINPDLTIYGTGAPREVLVCPYVFYSFSINSDGTASACFLDWDRQRLVGDAKTESVVDIWRGAKLNAIRELMLRGDRKSFLPCATCGQMTHGESDDIDPHREMLLKKFMASK